MNNAARLLAVKLLHTAIWAFFVALIFYVLYGGIADAVTPTTWVAAGLVLAEGVVLLVFGGKCPLTIIARKYSDLPNDNFDIFLPNWLARHNKLIFTSLYVIGLLLLGYRWVQRG